MTTKPSVVPSAENLMKRLLDDGTSEIEVDWGGILSTVLPVEDDVVFLVDASRELGSFLAGDLESHDVFLGDGLLQLTARREQGRVVVNLAHTPYLDRRFSKQHEIRLSQDDYRAAWGRLIDELCQLADSPLPG
jgi:hypothetical protein